jgi:hypothetical protein
MKEFSVQDSECILGFLGLREFNQTPILRSSTFQRNL